MLDPEKIADRQTLSDYLESLEYCIYEAGDENVDGTGTITINVTDKDGKVLTSLILWIPTVMMRKTAGMIIFMTIRSNGTKTPLNPSLKKLTG